MPDRTPEQVAANGRLALDEEMLVRLIGLLQGRGYVRIGCDEAAHRFAEIARARGVAVIETAESLNGVWVNRIERADA